jgi:GNAT superfamily N-acetyltransferase
VWQPREVEALAERAAVTATRTVDVVRTYLEMREPDALRAAPPPAGDVSVERVERPTPAFYRSLYAGVGGRYHWRDRLGWSDEQLAAHVALRSVSIHVLRVGGETAGFFELKRHFDETVEIAYFGLLQPYIGRGLGKYLLTRAIESAWALQPTRVWVHTCTLDDAAALPNYRARGMTPYLTETYQAQIPAE